MNAKLPALEGITNSEVVAEHLHVMNESRKAFTEAESSERLRRALRHNVRTYTERDIKSGDWVYYKRNDSERWRGKAKVMFVDNKLVFLRHGGREVKAHLSRVISVDDAEKGGVQLDSTENLEDEDDDSNSNDFPTVEKSCKNDDSVDVPTIGPIISAAGPIAPVINQHAQVPEHAPEAENGSMAANEGINNNRQSFDGNTLPLKEKCIQYRLSNADEWTMADVLGRGGKAKGINKNYVNLRTGDEEYGLDWKEVEEWCPIREEATVLITESSDHYLAKMSEIDRWKDNEVFDVVENTGQRTIDTRWVVSNKVKDNKQVIKCRLVAKGFQDPSKDEIRKDSPTASKNSLRLATTFISSMGYEVKSFDISAAFLQGEEIAREVYLRPPPEANCKGLWKLRKTVYGLGDASRKFFLKAKKELRNLGCDQSKLDPAVFYWKNKGHVEGVFVTHVDDFYYGGTRQFCEKVVSPLKTVFHLSSEHSQSFKYVGFEVVQEDDRITFSQNEYVSEILPIKITKERESMKNDTLTKTEQTEIKRRCGQLNWLTTHTRPDLSFDLAELSGRTTSLTVNDITKINKLIGKVKSSDTRIVFPRLSDVEDVKLAVYADASLGNLPDGGSQGGHVIFLVDSDGACAPITWQSVRIRRVVRSTIAAETLAMADALDAAILIEAMWKEMAGPQCKISIEGITDCHSLFDAVNSSKALTDKRLRIEMAMLREMQDKDEMNLSWTETHNQLADVLTKRGVNPLKLQKVLSAGHL